jgi:hypothetical protein
LDLKILVQTVFELVRRADHSDDGLDVPEFLGTADRGHAPNGSMT